MPDTRDIAEIPLAEAEAMLLALLGSLQAIDAQLSDRNRVQNGRRLGKHEYHAWRAAAVKARAAKLRQYHQLKVRVKAERARLNAERHARDATPAEPAAGGAPVFRLEWSPAGHWLPDRGACDWLKGRGDFVNVWLENHRPDGRLVVNPGWLSTLAELAAECGVTLVLAPPEDDGEANDGAKT